MSQGRTKPTRLIIIRRKQVITSLILTAFVATLSTGCFNDSSDISQVKEVAPNDAVANEQTDAVFYENVQQCQDDLTGKQQEYQRLEQEFNQGRLSQKPQEPAMKPEDCQAQMLLALKEHEGHAPVYQTLGECEAEGLDCTQATKNGGQVTQGYYPRFGGTFIYPYDPYPDFVYINTGGATHRVYRTTTVYRASSGGGLVTPYGRTLPHYKTGGKISVPQHTRFSAPARPSGSKGSGIIKGRSSTGFGSTYKSTGRGGVGK